MCSRISLRLCSCYGSPLTTRKSFSPGHWSAARALPQSTFPNSINLSPSLRDYGGGEGREGDVRMNNLKQRSFYMCLGIEFVACHGRLPFRRRDEIWDMEGGRNSFFKFIEILIVSLWRLLFRAMRHEL